MLRFPGTRPRSLGARQGRFSAPPSWKPNWVSSQVAVDDPHYIAPLAVAGDPQRALVQLRERLTKMERVALISAQPDYLHAEFSSAALGFTDDVELCCGTAEIHVRSSSRLGIRDFGVNRQRVEQLRRVLAV